MRAKFAIGVFFLLAASGCLAGSASARFEVKVEFISSDSSLNNSCVSTSPSNRVISGSWLQLQCTANVFASIWQIKNRMAEQNNFANGSPNQGDGATPTRALSAYLAQTQIGIFQGPVGTLMALTLAAAAAEESNVTPIEMLVFF